MPLLRYRETLHFEEADLQPLEDLLHKLIAGISKALFEIAQFAPERLDIYRAPGQPTPRPNPSLNLARSGEQVNSDDDRLFRNNTTGRPWPRPGLNASRRKPTLDGSSQPSESQLSGFVPNSRYRPQAAASHLQKQTFNV